MAVAHFFPAIIAISLVVLKFGRDIPGFFGSQRFQGFSSNKIVSVCFFKDPRAEWSHTSLQNQVSGVLPTNCHWRRLCHLNSKIKTFMVVSTPLKNMKISWDDYSQYMESHKIPRFQTTNQRYSSPRQFQSSSVAGRIRCWAPDQRGCLQAHSPVQTSERNTWWTSSQIE